MLDIGCYLVSSLINVLGPATRVLQAAEAALARLTSRGGRGLGEPAVQAIEHGAFAVLDYIARQLAGKPVSPVALFPQYRALQELAGATRIHPADLWPVAFSWRGRELTSAALLAEYHPRAAL